MHLIVIRKNLVTILTVFDCGTCQRGINDAGCQQSLKIIKLWRNARSPQRRYRSMQLCFVFFCFLAVLILLWRAFLPAAEQPVFHKTMLYSRMFSMKGKVESNHQLFSHVVFFLHIRWKYRYCRAFLGGNSFFF